MMVSSAIQVQFNEALRRYPAIDRLLGTLMRTRFQAAHPECFLISMLLSDAAHVLDFWEQQSAKFLDAVVDIDSAVQKIVTETEGHARGDSPRAFDARLKDLFLEICVVADLADRGLTHFLPLPAGRSKNHDFNCILAADDGQFREACLEVKNLRSPVGIIDTFVECRKALVSSHPEMSKLDILLTHHWDNTVDDTQIEAIDSFVEHLRDFNVPSETTISLSTTYGEKIEVRVNLSWGEGRVSMVRPIGGDFPSGPFIVEDRLFEKAVAAIEKAGSQLTGCVGVALLALNFDSPDATLSSDIAISLQDYVNTKWNGAITLFIFLQYRFLDVSRKTILSDFHERRLSPRSALKNPKASS